MQEIKRVPTGLTRSIESHQYAGAIDTGMGSEWRIYAPLTIHDTGYIVMEFPTDGAVSALQKWARTSQKCFLFPVTNFGENVTAFREAMGFITDQVVSEMEEFNNAREA